MRLSLSYYLALAMLTVIPPTVQDDDFEGLSDLIGPLQTETDPHNQWDKLLQKHVSHSGDVNYAAFKGDIELLQDYLAALSKTAPPENASKDEKLVFYINLYNAATVKLILDHYPVNSIKDIKNPWDKNWISVGDKLTSLGAIEHKILRKLNDPRIHFAINCASYSCPKLQNRAFVRRELEIQLNEATTAFVNDRTKNQISSSSVEISQIFKWYKSDFTKSGKLLDFINQYSDIPVNPDVKVQFTNYDWSLNEAK